MARRFALRRLLPRTAAVAALCIAALLVARIGSGIGAQPASSRIPVVEASDREALLEHLGQRIFVVGTVASAEWSATGRVMNIEFEGGEGSGLLAVVFERQRERFDEAFLGDFPGTITGRRLRLHGDIQEYGGYSEQYMGRPQMILNLPDRITILPDEDDPLPTTQPAQPGMQPAQR